MSKVCAIFGFIGTVLWVSLAFAGLQFDCLDIILSMICACSFGYNLAIELKSN